VVIKACEAGRLVPGVTNVHHKCIEGASGASGSPLT